MKNKLSTLAIVLGLAGSAVLSGCTMVWDDPNSLNPFSEKTLHFYSEQSMKGRKKPAWAYGSTPIQTPERYALDERRFRFYEGIS